MYLADASEEVLFMIMSPTPCVSAHGTCMDILGQYWDLGVKPCGTQLGISRGEKGAVRLPKILVLILGGWEQSVPRRAFAVRPV